MAENIHEDPQPDRFSTTSRALPEPALLTMEDVCAITSLGQSSVRKLRKSGALREVKIGRSVRFPRSSVERFLSELTAETAA